MAEKTATQPADPAEAARRAKQRAAQAAARKRQAEGVPTKKQRKKHRKEGTAPTPYPKKDTSTEAAGAWRQREFKDKGRNDFNKARTAQDAEAAERRQHDIVIVPIFWRQRPGEEAAVVGEAERIKRLLSAANLDIWVDRTHKKSPGQKLAFWEEVGVKWRIELGPDDVRQKQCVVSKAGEGRKSAEAALKIRDVSSVRRGDLLRALRDRLNCDRVPEIDADPALDGEHAKEADSALRKWEEAAGALPAAVRPRPKQLKLKIDISQKAGSHVVFGGDDDDDGLVMADDDSSSSSSSDDEE